MTKTYKAITLKLYPTLAQQSALNQHFGNVEFLYNKFVRYQTIAHQLNWPYLSTYDLRNLLPKMKRRYPFLKLSDSTALQLVAEHVDTGFQRYFHGHAQRPHVRLKRHARAYATVGKVKFIGQHYVKMPKFKQPFKVSHAKIDPDRIHRVTLKQSASGQYKLIVLVDFEPTLLSKTGQAVGIDVGLRNSVIVSNGIKYKAFHANDLIQKLKQAETHYFRVVTRAKLAEQTDIQNYQPHITPWQYRHNVEKARQKVATIKGKLKRRRYDFLQKLSKDLIEKYDVIVMENLNVQAMVKNPAMTKVIKNQGWSTLRHLLEQKSAWYHKQVILVNPSYTTQTCFVCGYRCTREAGDHVERDVHAWTCPQCGCYRDRDVNAAQNILKAADL